MDSTQHKLNKARPPRVQITYDVETGGAQFKKELPLVIGVIGEFSQEETEFRDRHFMHIDKDNFNEIMQGMRPKVEMLVDNELNEEGGQLGVALEFNSINDFSPERIAEQVEPLKKLLELREQLSDLRNRTASNDRLKEQLADLLKTRNRAESAETANEEGQE